MAASSKISYVKGLGFAIYMFPAVSEPWSWETDWPDCACARYIDCFAKSNTAYNSLYVNDHFAIQPHTAVLCNVTRDPWYCDTAITELQHYAMGTTNGGYHTYEIILAYASVLAGTEGKKQILNATLLAAFKQLVIAGAGSQAGHSAKVENHALDAALQQAYAPRVFPDLLKLNPKVASWKDQVPSPSFVKPP